MTVEKQRGFGVDAADIETVLGHSEVLGRRSCRHERRDKQRLWFTFQYYTHMRARHRVTRRSVADIDAHGVGDSIANADADTVCNSDAKLRRNHQPGPFLSDPKPDAHTNTHHP